MQQEQLTQSIPLSIEELKRMNAEGGPCITVVFPLHHEDTRQIRLTAKKVLEEVERRLETRKLERGAQEELLAPLQEAIAGIESEPEQKTAILMRAPGVFRSFFLPQELEESIKVEDHFYVLPLLAVMRENRPFYILALSQKHVRLLRCTNTTSEEVELPASVPHSLDEFIHTDKPDHVLDNSSAGGPGTGSMGRVMFGTGTDKERRDQYLQHFYKSVDRGVCELLKNDSAPLVLAGVEYELTQYRGESKFPRLVDEGVRGAPDGLKGGELHKRALEVIPGYWQKDVDNALAMYEQFGGSTRASSSLKEIVQAAHDGRVLFLFVADGAEHRGRFEESTHKVRTHKEESPGDEDLINAAAVETLNHAGDVFVVPRSKVPHGSQMAAVMRY